MTAVTTSVIPLRRSPRRGPYVRTLLWLVRGQFKVALWFVAILTVLWGGAVLVASRFGDIEMSIMQFARQGAGVWFPFSIAVSSAAAALRPHVAAGMTRRVFARAALSASLVMAAVYGGVITLGFVIERAVYQANGWHQTITDSSWSFADVSDPAAVLGDGTLVIVVASLSGLLVGAVYLRYGAWIGTLSLPFTVGPVLVTLAALSRAVPIDGLTQPARIAIVVGIAGVLAAAFVAVVRTVPVLPPKG